MKNCFLLIAAFVLAEATASNVEILILVEGETLKLKCDDPPSDGINRGTYTWTRDGKVLQEQKSNLLTIADVTDKENGVYGCEANHWSCVIWWNVTRLIVIGGTGAPVIDILNGTIVEGYEKGTGIAGKTVLVEGETLSLSCNAGSATGSNVKYIWTRIHPYMGRTVSKEQKTNVLTITNVTLEDDGFYTCVTDDGKLTSKRSLMIKVGVIVPPTINGETDVIDGDPLILHCSSLTYGLGEVKYQWKLGSEDIDVGGNDTDYNIMARMGRDSGNYTCTVTVEGVSATSAVHTVNIIGVAQVPDMVEVSLTPSSEIIPTEPFTITCNADAVNVPSQYRFVEGLKIKRLRAPDSQPEELAIYYPFPFYPLPEPTHGSRNWTIVKEHATPEEIFAKRSTRSLTLRLTINDAQWSDAGMYQCEISYYTNGTVASKTGYQILTARVPDNLDVSLTPSSEIIPTEPFTITCNADAVNVPSQYRNVYGLKIKRLRASDSQPEDLAIYYPYAPFPVLEPTHGSRKWTAVKETAPPRPSNLDGDSRSLTLRLTINDAQYSDAGMYQCEVSYYPNAFPAITKTGYQNLTARAQVPDMVEVSLTPSSEIIPTEPFTITCNADAVNVPSQYRYVDGLKLKRLRASDSQLENLAMYYPYYHYYLPEPTHGSRNWTTVKETAPPKPYSLDGDTRSLTLRLTINDPQSSDAGMYQCEVSYFPNSIPITSKTGYQNLTVRVPDNLDVSLTPSSEIIPTEPLTITCNADAVNVPSQYRYVDGLTIKRLRASDSQPEDLAIYYPYAPFPVLEPTHGSRNWTTVKETAPPQPYSLDGDTRSLTLRLTINDPQSSDAGMYQCEVSYYPNAFLAITKTGYQNLTARAQVPDMVEVSLTPSSEIIPTESFTITCNADAVNVPSQYRYVDGLKLKRLRASDSQLENLAMYYPYYPYYLPEPTHGSRNWTTVKETAPPKPYSLDGDTRSLTLRLTINDPQSSDAGMYQCEVSYFPNSIPITSKTGYQNLTVRGNQEDANDNTHQLKSICDDPIWSKFLGLDCDSQHEQAIDSI